MNSCDAQRFCVGFRSQEPGSGRQEEDPTHPLASRLSTLRDAVNAGGWRDGCWFGITYVLVHQNQCLVARKRGANVTSSKSLLFDCPGLSTHCGLFLISCPLSANFVMVLYRASATYAGCQRMDLDHASGKLIGSGAHIYTHTVVQFQPIYTILPFCTTEMLIVTAEEVFPWENTCRNVAVLSKEVGVHWQKIIGEVFTFHLLTIS